MKRTLLAALVAAFSSLCASAQVENRALQLTSEGKVECGVMPELNGIGSFTVQMWINPTAWSGTVIERGNLRIALSGTTDVAVTAGDLTMTATAKGTGQWQQLTVINAKGDVTVLVDGKLAASKGGATAIDNDAPLVLGEGYAGLIDEVRIWNIALPANYGYFWNNTLNEFNDLVPNLMVYYKMDHEEWTSSLVDYKSLWAATETNHHGQISGGTFVTADNAKLPYLLNGAYTANERFYDRAIEREAYLLSNDIINLGIVSKNDGHLEYSSPCNHATLTGTAAIVTDSEERGHVLSLDGNGSMQSPGTTLTAPSTYTVEGWIYIDEWVEGATIMRKGTVSGTDGFSITLGAADKKNIEVKASGETYVFVCGAVSQGRGKPTVDALPLQQWVYLGVSVSGTASVTGAFTMTCGGTTVSANTTQSAATGKYEILGADGQPAVWGEGFKGKMDQLAVFNQNFDAGGMAGHGNNYMMPAIKKVVTSLPMQKASALYLFEDETTPGWDSYSQDEWLKIMKSAFDGYRGYQMRISVKSHDGWDTTISNATCRQNFAQDLARLSAPYDGVELDLEWNYNTSWAAYGLLIDAIRSALPADKTFMVSCHNVTYAFVPKNRYSKVDGFTFQQYGPQPTHFTWNTFQTKAKEFEAYGYPKDKIYLSYATTTSNSSTGQAIKGIRGDNNNESPLFAAGYTPSDDADTWTVTGQGTFTYMSPVQVYRRAQYVTDNHLQGIFYWDMGNDLKDWHQPYHYAKMASYGLNANVDRIVTEATPHHPTATGEKAEDPDAGGEVQEGFGTRVTMVNKNAEIHDGAYICCMAAQISFAGLSWLGNGCWAVSTEPEMPTYEAVFQLESADKGYHMRHVASGKYVGRDGTAMAMYDNATDEGVGEFQLDAQTAANANVYEGDVNNLYNLTDQNADKLKALKLGNNAPDYGDGGNGPWKLWRIYACTRAQVDKLADIADGITARPASAGAQRTEVYDLQGRRVSDTQSGLYIIDGRKVVVK